MPQIQNNNADFEQRIVKRKIRLVIAIPALLLLFTISTGIINYQIIDIYSEAFTQAGITKKTLEEISDNLTITTAVLGALSILFGIGLAYSIIRPIKTITESARDVAAGNLSKIVAIQNVNEIGELGTTFNSMLGSLQSLISERNRFFFESLSQGMITLDKDGNILTVNPTAERILKVSSKKLIGLNILQQVSSKEDLSHLKNIFKNVIDTQQPLEDKAISFPDADGNKLDISLTMIPFRDAKNKIIGFLMSFYDHSIVTSLQRRLRHSDQLAAIGTFATGVAHEIRNPLCSICSIAQMLREKIEAGTKESKYAELIIGESERVNNLITQLLDFAHPDNSNPEPVDINNLIGEALLLTKSATHVEKKNIMMNENYLPDLPKITLQRDRVLQALINIIQNAIDAVNNDGLIDISTELTSGDYSSVVIKIRNTGDMISDEAQKHIFEPFFTTKDTGTGLGLAITYQIVNSNNGSVYFESNPEATTFFIRFIV